MFSTPYLLLCPTRDTSTSAIVLLPNKTKYGLDAGKALQQLNIIKLLKWNNWATSLLLTANVEVVSLHLPRFTVTVEMLKLKDVSLGCSRLGQGQ